MAPYMFPNINVVFQTIFVREDSLTLRQSHNCLSVTDVKVKDICKIHVYFTTTKPAPSIYISGCPLKTTTCIICPYTCMYKIGTYLAYSWTLIMPQKATFSGTTFTKKNQWQNQHRHAWISNYSHIKQWYVDTHPCPKSDGGLFKTP